jgi:tRNA-specific 2-thiouridylase
MRVCAHLGIPFRELDLSQEYKRDVADAMVSGYARGETPNPDVLCNRSVKFGHFLRWAREQGAEYVATGHYARTSDGHLLRGTDPNKDQSYFLSMLGAQELACVLFPIGHLHKPDVRALAKTFGLPNADRPDSQGLCFVGDVSLRDFLARFITLAPGSVLDMTGKTIGTHDGAVLYTKGERHGFSAHAREPMFVVRTDVHTNTITVSSNRDDATTVRVPLDVPHWVGESPVYPYACEAQVRYRSPAVSVTLAYENDAYHAIFSAPQIASPGQSLVFYRGDECLGSAVIR